MKILNLTFGDSAGAAYTLSHAINKHTMHQAINIRTNDSYINYPTFANMRDYTQPTINKIVENSDAIVFHSAVKPYFQGLKLTKKMLKGKTIILYFHGSDLRGFGADILKQANHYFGEYTTFVSTPDLLEYAPNASWMPVCRSFIEISEKYSLSPRDKTALNSFGVAKTVINIAHAPTNEAVKGSEMFYRVVTQIVKANPNITYVPIKGHSWDSCLRMISQVDIFLDQAKLGAYGTAAVEASIFKIPTLCLIDETVGKHIQQLTGLDQPFITFTDENDLAEKLFTLSHRPDLRNMFGEKQFEYCRKVHDEKPVVERFFAAAKLEALLEQPSIHI